MPLSIPPTLHHLDHFVMTVADIKVTTQFYSLALGMRAETFHTPDGTPRHALFFGTSKINLHQQGAEFDPKAAHPTPGSADLCFLSETAIPIWIAHLADAGIPIEQGPVARTGARGPLTSIYMRDPDQNLIEISTLDQRP